MNEVYLQRLQEDLRLKNYAKNTREDYYRFVVRFLDFTGKELHRKRCHVCHIRGHTEVRLPHDGQ